MSWSDTLADNGIMMEEGEAAKAIALGISAKTALSGGTTSVDVSGMCSSLFEPVDWGFCDAVDQVLCVIGPRFVDDNNAAYSSSISELITVAGFTTAVYGATNGEVRLRGGGMLFDSEWIEQRKGILNLFVRAGVPVEGATFSETALNTSGWTCSYGAVTGETVSLPHSVDAVGSTANPTSYYRGNATYTRDVTLSSARRYYLYLEPVYQRADVALSGQTVSGDTTIDVGATGRVFTTECPGLPVVIDLTALPFANGSNTLTVVADNTSTFWNVPYSGSLNINNLFGGATLCEAGKLCFDPTAYGTRRCHLSTAETTLTAKVTVKSNSNQTDSDTVAITAEVYLNDGTTAEVSSTQYKTVAPGESLEVTFTLAVTSSTNYAWDIGSGNTYRVKFTLYENSTAYDTVEDRVGFRSFSASKHDSSNDQYGFTLNGTGRSLYGISYHHWDRMPTAGEYDADWEIISALKPQMIRFTYFPAMHYLLDKCDAAGIVALVEIPWIRDFADGEWAIDNNESYRNAWRQRYQHNITANATAMINELYNHPSVIFYSIGTGLGTSSSIGYVASQAHGYVKDELLPAVRAADSSRLVCIELATNDSAAWTDVSDIIMERLNSGWDGNAVSNAVTEANTWNGKNNTIPFAILDYSFGANPTVHVDWSSASTKPSSVSSYNTPFPEEYQAYAVEQYAGSALALKWPVFNLYGAMFDWNVNTVSAGGKEGVAQLGLATRDRNVVKDAYYYLKAMWNSTPMVHITQKRYSARTSSPITLRIYTNCAKVEVWSGNTKLDTKTLTGGTYAVDTASLTLTEGDNAFTVLGYTNSGDVTASCNDTILLSYEDTSGTYHVVIYSDSAIVNSGILGAKVLPNTESQSVTWSSSDSNVATINSGGTVTVVADGTASFTATAVSGSTSATKTKAIPCYVRGATDSLYYKLTAGGATYDKSYEKAGLTFTNNKNGTYTINGTLDSTPNDSTQFHLWPGSNRPSSNALFPVWDIPGDQLLTAEIISGTVTGSYYGDTPLVVAPLNETFDMVSQAYLNPLNDRFSAGDVNAKLISGSTLGFAGYRLLIRYQSGTVFDNLVLRVQSFKQANTYFNSGLLESYLIPANSLVLHPKGNDANSIVENMYSHNADGSQSELIPNPNAGAGVPDYVRVTDGFAMSSYSVPLSGSTIAGPGDVLKFSVIMKNWPPHYTQKDNASEFSFVLWYADGTEAAKLKYAYQDDGTGVDFTGGTASTSFIASKVVDCAGWHFHHFAFGGNLDSSECITFYMKLEEVDPSAIPPNSITAYGSTYLVNSGKVTAVGSPITANQSVTWSSSNTSVATVDSSGNVTVVADGQCTFTATSAVDSTKSGSVTITCYKVTTENLFGNISQVVLSNGTSSVIYGATVTNNLNGTYTLDGTLTSNSPLIRIFPIQNAGYLLGFFPKSGVSGDVLVWLEYVSGTLTGTKSSGYDEDLQVRLFDESNSNTELENYRLEYQQNPSKSGMTQCKLVTGSTAGIRRMALGVPWASGAVFDNYTIKLGVKKFSSLGNIYNGGLLENYLPTLCSYCIVGSKGTRFWRQPDGSLFMQVGSTINWMNSSSGYVRLTGLPIFSSNTSGLVTNSVIAASGGTYKFKVKILTPITVDTSASSSSTRLSFCLLGSDGSEQADLQHISGTTFTNVFDSNLEAETTFTATANIDCVAIRFATIKNTSEAIHIGIRLEAVTT